MIDREIPGASRPSRRLLLLCASLWLVIVLAFPFAAPALNAVKPLGFPLGFWAVAQWAGLALSALAIVFAWRSRPVEASLLARVPRSGIALGAETPGAAGALGFAGAVSALGFDGLAYCLGMAAGLALMTILIAPRFVLYPGGTVFEVFANRFASPWPQRAAYVAFSAAAVWLLAADIRGGALAIQAITGGSLFASAIVFPAVLAAAWAFGDLIPWRGIAVAVFAAVLAASLAVLIAYSIAQGRWPYIGEGQGLSDLGQLDQTLVTRKLADFRSIKAMNAPFLALSAANFYGLVFALALGVAAAPHLIGRHISRDTASPGDAPSIAAFATFALAFFLIGVPALTILGRVAFESQIAGGIETANVPAAILEANAAGWSAVCGATSDMAATIADACRAVPGHKGLLRLQDFSLDPDAFLLTVPRLTGLSQMFYGPLWIAALLAALIAGRAIVSTLVPVSWDRASFRPGPASAAAGVVLVSVTAVINGASGIPALTAEGCAILGSSIFPALILGLFWRRMTGAGATAAIVAGLGLAAVYIVGARLFPPLMFEWTGALSNAAPAAVKKYAALKSALTDATAANQNTALQALIDQARQIANWYGLIPAASVLFAAPAAFATGVIVSWFTERPPDGVVTV